MNNNLILLLRFFLGYIMGKLGAVYEFCQIYKNILFIKNYY